LPPSNLFPAGLVLSAWGGFKRRILTTLWGLIAMGLGILVMGLLPPSAFVIAVATILFIGIMSPIVNGPLLAAVQAAVAPEMQGRVFTLITTMASGMSPIGLIIAGPIADKLGVQTWFIIGGVVTGLMGISGFFIPVIMHFEDGRSIPYPTVTEQPVLSTVESVGERTSESSKSTAIEVDYT
jgi:MFS transporter, DHA3 family, macrolide efflux protein